jgi:acetyl-CoA carboxylase carboxyl transferase subunit beta
MSEHRRDAKVTRPTVLGELVADLPGSDALRCSVATISGQQVVLAQWDFSHHGGSYGVADADAFVAATRAAVERRLPLVSVMRSGGTRLPEGMRALVGIPRSLLALDDLRSEGLPHISVADHPTTGGVWVSIGALADLRIAVVGALVGFAGPRPVAAMTGRALAAGANTAEAALRAGLVDVLAEPGALSEQIGQALAALAPDRPEPVTPGEPAAVPALPGDAQVAASRAADRVGGAELIASLLTDGFPLTGPDGSVMAVVGRIAGRRVAAVALGSDRSAMPGPGGFALLTRAARLAGSLDLALVVLIDCPGADPHTEAGGLTPAIATALAAVLDTRAPTISLVHGEGGSGGALAGAVTDLVGVGPYGWFAALGPDGAAAALRIDPAEASRLMRVTPAELLADGFADEFVPAGAEVAWIAAAIDRLRDEPVPERLARRRTRWSSPLPESPG